MVQNLAKNLRAVAAVAFVWALSACLVPDAVTNNAFQTTPTPSPTLSVASGGKIAKIIFTEGTTGSFDPYSGNGTQNTASGGYAAVRFFDGANHVITRPSWLTSFRIGITGNTTSTSTNCARFHKLADANRPKCQYWLNTADILDPTKTWDHEFSCQPQADYFQVSEWDCVNSVSVPNGAGRPDDKVYLRATFSENTDYMTDSENILVTVEYEAAGLRTAESALDGSCDTGTIFDPSKCSGPSWQAFVSTTAKLNTLPVGVASAGTPLGILTPPAFNYGLAKSRLDSYGLVKKQFIIPIAAMRNTSQSISVFQLSRMASQYKAVGAGSDLFDAICGNVKDVGTTPYGNSPLCVGVVFRSITFMRM